MNPTHAPIRRVRSLVRLALCLTLAACSARGVGGGTTTTGDSGTPQPMTLSFTCAQLCAPLASAPSCAGAGVSTCQSSCGASLASTPAACVASANALYACTQTATPSCSAGTQFPFAACQSQYSAYVACVSTPQDAGSPAVDSGVPPRDSGMVTPMDECSDAADCASCTGRSSCGWCAGRCWRGSSTGPIGGSCGGTSWAWTSGQCQSSPPPRDAGGPISPACQSCAFSTCPDQANACSAEPACLQCVVSPNSSCLSNPRFAAIAECACGGCAEACGSLCAMF